MAPETFTLIVAPATIVVLAALIVLAVRVASKRFAGREQQLLTKIASERGSQRLKDSPVSTRKVQSSPPGAEERKLSETVKKGIGHVVRPTERDGGIGSEVEVHLTEKGVGIGPEVEVRRAEEGVGIGPPVEVRRAEEDPKEGAGSAMKRNRHKPKAGT